VLGVQNELAELFPRFCAEVIVPLSGLKFLLGRLFVRGQRSLRVLEVHIHTYATLHSTNLRI
jgi:hypothetical protein